MQILTGPWSLPDEHTLDYWVQLHTDSQDLIPVVGIGSKDHENEPLPTHTISYVCHIMRQPSSPHPSPPLYFPACLINHVITKGLPTTCMWVKNQSVNRGLNLINTYNQSVYIGCEYSMFTFSSSINGRGVHLSEDIWWSSTSFSFGRTQSLMNSVSFSLSSKRRGGNDSTSPVIRAINDLLSDLQL